MSLLGCADPYVKVVLLYNGQCIGKKKTQVKKKTLNPTFNESFMFDLPPACYTPVPGSSGRTRLQGIRLHFTVYDWDRVTRNEVIGRLEIGDQAQRPEMGDQAHDVSDGRPGPTTGDGGPGPWRRLSDPASLERGSQLSEKTGRRVASPPSVTSRLRLTDHELRPAILRIFQISWIAWILRKNIKRLKFANVTVYADRPCRILLNFYIRCLQIIKCHQF